jgi:light-regulated signal transduction histidine kinase (bacteriophytochrome)
VEADKAHLEEHMSTLERSNEDLEQFAAVAAHDLQAPLRTTVCFLQLLDHKCKGRLTPEEQMYLKYSIDGTNTMKELVEGLLVYARVDSHENEFQPVNCNEILYQAQVNLSVMLSETKAKITAQKLPIVMGQKSALLQLFQNLLSNALKYCIQRPEILIDAVPQDSDWVFSVKDNGIGIEERYRKKVFNLFQRLHTRTEYSGSGIGLATCKKIVERHGGRIWVESQVGRGSCFYFTLKRQNLPH